MGRKIEITQQTELIRGCGYRQTGFYLRADRFIGNHCGKLPIPLIICPCCGEGIKQTRSWRKIDLNRLAQDVRCSMGMPISAEDQAMASSSPGLNSLKANIENQCNGCHLGGSIPSVAYLLWVGAQSYSAGEFLDEGSEQGISRRIPSTRGGNPQLPRQFKVGESLVALAHPEVCLTEEGDGLAPGLFCFFRPQAVEYVVDTSKMRDQTYIEYLERLSERGCTLIQVERGQGAVVANESAVTAISPSNQLDFLGEMQ